jgi:hypothetical protein
MVSEKIIKIGYIIGLIGVALSLVRILIGFTGAMTWLESNEPQYVTGGYFFFLVIFGWIIAIISILIGKIGDRNASIGLFITGALFVFIYIYSNMMDLQSPDVNAYRFQYFKIGPLSIRIPLEGALYLLSGVLLLIGEKKS